MTIHWKAHEEHFLIEAFVFRTLGFLGKNAFSEFLIQSLKRLQCQSTSELVLSFQYVQCQSTSALVSNPTKNPIQILRHCDVMGIPLLYERLYQCNTWPIVKNNLFDDDQRGISLYLDTVHSVLPVRTARGQLFRC
jgi:hypothetical protein